MSSPVRLSMASSADAEAACEILWNWADWPSAFPRTIQSVRLIKSGGSEVTLQVLHRSEGEVVNVLSRRSDGAIRLKEFKARYDAEFHFFASPASTGSNLHIHACIWLKGVLAVAGCFATPLIRSRMRRYLLEPLASRADQLRAHGEGRVA